jgi:hypothetical protein
MKSIILAGAGLLAASAANAVVIQSVTYTATPIAPQSDPFSTTIQLPRFNGNLACINNLQNCNVIGALLGVQISFSGSGTANATVTNNNVAAALATSPVPGGGTFAGEPQYFQYTGPSVSYTNATASKPVTITGNFANQTITLLNAQPFATQPSGTVAGVTVTQYNQAFYNALSAFVGIQIQRPGDNIAIPTSASPTLAVGGSSSNSLTSNLFQYFVGPGNTTVGVNVAFGSGNYSGTTDANLINFGGNISAGGTASIRYIFVAPEPGAIAAFGVGLLALGLRSRRKI